MDSSKEFPSIYVIPSAPTYKEYEDPSRYANLPDKIYPTISFQNEQIDFVMVSPHRPKKIVSFSPRITLE